MATQLEPITARPIQRPDATHEIEDETCTLVCQYVELFDGMDDPIKAQIVRIFADFGGRNQVEIPLSCFSGRRLLELESLCTDDANEREALRDQDHKDGADRSDEWPF